MAPAISISQAIVAAAPGGVAWRRWPAGPESEVPAAPTPEPDGHVGQQPRRVSAIGCDVSASPMPQRGEQPPQATSAMPIRIQRACARPGVGAVAPVGPRELHAVMQRDQQAGQQRRQRELHRHQPVEQRHRRRSARRCARHWHEPEPARPPHPSVMPAPAARRPRSSCRRCTSARRWRCTMARLGPSGSFSMTDIAQSWPMPRARISEACPADDPSWPARGSRAPVEQALRRRRPWPLVRGRASREGI